MYGLRAPSRTNSPAAVAAKAMTSKMAALGPPRVNGQRRPDSRRRAISKIAA